MPWQIVRGRYLARQTEFRAGARSRAEQAFSLDLMVEKYLKGLMKSIKLPTPAAFSLMIPERNSLWTAC